MDKDTWKIWYKVYQDGQHIEAGLWHREYARKCDAVRVANIRLKKSLNRTDGVSFTYVVSKTNPWSQVETIQGKGRGFFDEIWKSELREMRKTLYKGENMFLIGDRVRVADGDRVYDGVVSHTSNGTSNAYVLYMIDDDIKAKWIDIHELERMQDEINQKELTQDGQKTNNQ